MNIPLSVQRVLYGYYMYFPNNLTVHYFQAETRGSPSLQELGNDISTKVAQAGIALNRLLRRNYLIFALTYVAYVGAIAIIAVHNSSHPDVTSISVLVGAVFIVALLIRIRVRLTRSSGEYKAIVRLFFAINFLDRNATDWPNSAFRWKIVERLERIARAVEQIPLASHSVAPDVKEETLRLSRLKAQAIRQLELWVIRPADFTFTDLIHRLVLDLHLMVENRWYDLPEASGFRITRSKWILVLQVGVAVIMTGGAIFLVAFSAKTGPAAPIIGLILVALALALLNSAGISTNFIDQVLQTSSKVISRKLRGTILLTLNTTAAVNGSNRIAPG